MTDEEILSAAVSVGLLNDCLDVETMSFCILAFAKLVGEIERFKEREACAKLCEEEQAYWGWDKVVDAASLIRARGK